MNESSDDQQNGRAILCQQDGELSEFAEMLAELNVPVQQHAGKLPSPDDLKGAGIAILHGRRLLDGHGPNLDRWPRTIAVIDASSKTLSASLNRTGVAMVIHRPIHPRALRLLLLHEIYAGPERRGKKRILIGHPIQAKSGLFKQDATLLELSRTGARIETLNTPKIGAKIRLFVGKDLTLAKPIRLDGRVVRCIRASGTKGRINGEIGIELTNANAHSKIIESMLRRFAMGPASWEGEHAAAGASDVTEVTDATDVTETFSPEAQTAPAIAEPLVETPNPGETQKLPPQYKPKDLPPRAPLQPDPMKSKRLMPIAEPSERRGDSRIPYERRIVALGEEAARVLVGQDLSAGGMRIAENDSVGLGDSLRVALHCGSELEPLVVLADVVRDDGGDGLVLTFKDLSETAVDHLEKIIASSKPIQAGGEEPDSAGSNLVLGEMLERIEASDD
ncbi:MAG: PilZ domain-containing protein [Myxococcota bacterium]